MRRNRDPGTRNPLSCPLSKQRMMVCWLTLQILAASPVVKTVFMGSSTPPRALARRTSVVRWTSFRKRLRTEIIPDFLPLPFHVVVASQSPHRPGQQGAKGPGGTFANRWVHAAESEKKGLPVLPPTTIITSFLNLST